MCFCNSFHCASLQPTFFCFSMPFFFFWVWICFWKVCKTLFSHAFFIRERMGLEFKKRRALNNESCCVRKFLPEAVKLSLCPSSPAEMCSGRSGEGKEFTWNLHCCTSPPHFLHCVIAGALLCPSPTCLHPSVPLALGPPPPAPDGPGENFWPKTVEKF